MAIKIIGTTVIDDTRNITNVVNATLSGRAVFTDTAALKIPVGTVAQRPASPVEGDCRFNSDTKILEVYDGVSAWKGIEVTTTSTNTLTNKTITNVVLDGSVTEEIFAVTGTTPALDPVNGTVQTWTLSGASTPTESFAAGESLTLMIDDGTASTITWPATTWVNNGGLAPTLAATGYTVIALWKVSTTLYGALVGSGA